MIRILHYIGTLELGGSQAFVMELYRNMKREEIQFDFVIFPEWRGPLYEEIIRMGGKVYESPKYNGINHMEYVRWWQNFLNEHPEYQVIHGHVRSVASIYLPIVRKAGRYTILHSHSMSNGHGFSALIKTMLQLPVRHMADYYMACSDEAGRWLFGNQVVSGSRYRTIPNAINTSRFLYSEEQRMVIRKELEANESFLIGHVGRFVEVKNHVFLIKLLEFILDDKLISNPKLLLIGDGPLKTEMEQLVEKMGLVEHVIFVGNATDVERFYPGMDVFVFPSKWEGLGIAVVEAQTNGLECVISEGIPDRVDIGAGLIRRATLENMKEWAENLYLIYKQKKERRSYDFEAREAGYDIKSSALFMQEFYVEAFHKCVG